MADQTRRQGESEPRTERTAAGLGPEENVFSRRAPKTRGQGGEGAPSDAPPDSSAAAPHPRLGTVVAGRWTLDGLLGTGGMGEVFSATHRNGSRVAIKVLRRTLSFSPAVVRRFRREAYLANQVDHPAAVGAVDDGELEDGCPYLVMELLSGESLAARVRRRGVLSTREVVGHLRTVLSVLVPAHAKGILHLDLKPANLFLCSDGRLCVLDFGIAKVMEGAELGPTTRTVTGAVIGTVGYMAPEQAGGDRDAIGPTTDLWAVGATAVALLTGRQVHEAQSDNEALLFAATAPVPPTATRFPAIPAALAGWLDKALSFDRADRFASAATMRDALDSVSRELSAMPSERPPAERVEPHRPASRGKAIAIGSVVLAVALVLATLFVRSFNLRAPEDSRTVASGATQAQSSGLPAIIPSAPVGVPSSSMRRPEGSPSHPDAASPVPPTQPLGASNRPTAPRIPPSSAGRPLPSGLFRWD